MHDALGELEQTLRILMHNPMDTFFKTKLYSQINEGEIMLSKYEHKLNELLGIHPDSCRDIDDLMEDFKTYKKKFIVVKKESMCYLPEEAPNTSSPQVTESQPSTASKNEVQCGSPEEDPEISSTGSAVLQSSSLLARWKTSQKTLTMPEDQPSSSTSSLE